MSNKAATDQDVLVFKQAVGDYKRLIDEDIKDYSKRLQNETLKQYGASTRVAVDAYHEILVRGGKRIRGSLVILGYEMSGGTDHKMIIEAARAIEMIHAYILIIDDIQDRSLLRRGGPSAHALLADYHKKHLLADSSEHFGVAMALNSALTGAHEAQTILAGLDVDEGVRLRVLNIVNRTMVVTAYGQTNDIFNEVSASVDEDAVNRVLEWKTANYTLLNPLHVGMVLAGADEEDISAITEYAMHVGKAFQITDDILGIFGSEFESGKSTMDDIKEGKRTLLTVYALEHTDNGNKNFLLQMLGNHELKPAEFQRCKDIIVDCGALDYARNQADHQINRALSALDKEKDRWSSEGVGFLRGLAHYLLLRQS